MISEIKFANPEYFYLFIVLPLYVIWYFFNEKKSISTIGFSNFKPLILAPTSIKVKLRFILPILRVLTFSLIIICLARPQSSSSKSNVTTEGIDIVICLDISNSMLAEDFKPNRIETAKKTAAEFIKNRIDDRIGLVIFAGESYTQTPVTIDHDVLINMLYAVKLGMIQDGTAIGNGLATAVSRLKDSKAKSKVIILLTDGENNAGEIAPETAAEIAATFKIRVYTIGIGTIGEADMPVQTQFGMQKIKVPVKIDEPLLRKIASLTKGEYYRATGNKSLKEIYSKIDKLEKTKVDVSYFSKKTEEYFPFLLAGLLSLLLEIVLKYFYFRKFP